MPVDMYPTFVPLVIELLTNAAVAPADTGVIQFEICGTVLQSSIQPQLGARRGLRGGADDAFPLRA